jgi:predicted secreted acid phosphatase
MALLINSKLYSQKAILNDLNDTVICLSINQSKFILSELTRLEYKDSLVNIQQTEINLLNQSIKEYQNIGNMQSNQLQLAQNNLEIQSVQINSLKLQNEELELKIKKETRKKKIAIVLGLLLTGFFAIT